VESLIPGLHASAPEVLPFATSLQIRAFLLRRERGNLLIYAAPAVEADAEAIEALGGISRQYLNHWHEASFGCQRTAKTFGAALLCNEKDAPLVGAKCKVDQAFSERASLDDDFELVPIPGHTEGATAYLWDSGEHRCLFTGDTIYLNDGEWIAAMLEGSSDRDDYVKSLELIRALDFDVLVPWAATGGRPYHAFTDRADARLRIDTILERLRRGEDH